MSRYDQYVTKLTGVTYILAPLLMVLGAAVYVSGMQRSADGTSSWVEGILLGFGILMMVPVIFDLARRLGQRAPRLAIFCAVTGLGMALGVIPANYRVLQESLALAGINESVWAIVDLHAGGVPFIIWMGLGFLSFILLGIGFLWKGGLARSSAIMLALAPILFVVGQGGDETIAWWQVNIFYPLACLTWLATLAPTGWGMLTRGAAASAQTAAAAAD